MVQTAPTGRTDLLQCLNSGATLQEKLHYLHQTVRQRYPFICRIAVALYDRHTDLLTTFVHSSGGSDPLSHYQAPLNDSVSLQRIVERRRPRIVNDMRLFSRVPRLHVHRLQSAGYIASYTLPMYQDGELIGFIFYNADQRNVFASDVCHYLDLIGQLLTLSVSHELGELKSLLAAIKTAVEITHHFHEDTGTHVNRMAHYTRLIAIGIADSHQLNDEFIEMLFSFAPLHDIGKIGIPDSLLSKPGALTADEFTLIKSHTTKGREIVDTMLANFSLSLRPYADILRNIVHYHHEAYDGSGYPAGLSGKAIPIEARIAAVADVFDALTSRRSYKRAWSNEEAFTLLQQQSGRKFDSACVKALIGQSDAIKLIQQQFEQQPFA